MRRHTIQPDNETQQSNQIEFQIKIKKAKNSFWKDFIETFTGLSGRAFTVGSKITSETIIYSGEKNSYQELSGFIFSILSIVGNSIDFLLIPLGYLYKLWAKEPVPFNRTNNTKWLMAGITLSLAIVSLVVAVTSQIISFVSAGIALIESAVSFFKLFYDKYMLTNKIIECRRRIDAIYANIQQNMQKKAKTASSSEEKSQRIYEETLPDDEQYKDDLKDEYIKLYRYEQGLCKIKSALEVTFNSLRFVLAVTVLVGTLLSINPATALIGVSMLAGAAIASLAMLITRKTIQVAHKRKEQKNRLSDETIINVKLDSTSLMIEKLGYKPSTPALSRLAVNRKKYSINVANLNGGKYMELPTEAPSLRATV